MLIPILPIIFTDPTSPSYLAPRLLADGAVYSDRGDHGSLWPDAIYRLANLRRTLRCLWPQKAPHAWCRSARYIANALWFWDQHRLARTPLYQPCGCRLCRSQLLDSPGSDCRHHRAKDRAKNFGLIGAAFGLGFIIGPLLADSLPTGHTMLQRRFGLQARLVFVTYFYHFFFPETRKGRAHTSFISSKVSTISKQLSKIKDARPVYLANFFYWSGFAFFTTFIGVLLVRYGFDAGDRHLLWRSGRVGGDHSRILSCAWSQKVLAKHGYSGSPSFRCCHDRAVSLYANVIWLYVLLPFMAVPQGLSMANLVRW
jgi:hypothetical protein